MESRQGHFDIGKITDKLNSEINEATKLRAIVKPSIQVSVDDFAKVMDYAGNKYLAASGADPNYQLPEYAKVFHDWLNGNEYKGITLSGPVGCGKTTMMRTFYAAYVLILSQYKFGKAWLHYNKPKIITSRELSKAIIEEKDMPMMDNSVSFIDDIGREVSKVNNYGTQRYPFAEWLMERERFAIPIFATTNFSIEELLEIYGIAAVDRLLSWTKIVTVTGKSKR